MPGWKQPTDPLPIARRPAPSARLSQVFGGVDGSPDIAIVSLGASRDQTIIVEDPIHGPKRALLYENGTSSTPSPVTD